MTEFGGLFKRGQIVKPGEQTPSMSATASERSTGNGMTIEEGLKSIRDMESVAERYYRDGRVEESKEMLARAATLKKEIEDFAKSRQNFSEKHDRGVSGDMEEFSVPTSGNIWENCDFNNPSEEMIATAKEAGLDLKDPRY